jgi:hypothetical protein
MHKADGLEGSRAAVMRAAVWSCLCLFVASAAGGQQQKPNPCVGGVTPDDSLYKYEKRGAICEGTIQEKVASDQIALRSFTDQLGYSREAKQALQVRWNSPELPGAVRVEGHDIGASVRYRMDSAPMPLSVRELLWDSSTLRQLPLTRDQLGVLAYWEGAYGGRNERIYLPSIVSQQKMNEGPQYEVVALIGRPLASVKVTLNTVPKGTAPLFSDRTFAVKDNVARITFERPPAVGVYRLFIKGEVSITKEPVSTNLLFYECTGRPAAQATNATQPSSAPAAPASGEKP